MGVGLTLGRLANLTKGSVTRKLEVGRRTSCSSREALRKG